MTIQELIDKAALIDIRILLTVFLLPVIIVWIIGRIHGTYGGGRSPWKYIYSVLVYLVCIPGMFSAVITAYSLFFIRQNLLNVNFIVYFIPLISMIVTLVLVGNQVQWDRIPGFDRLYALMVLIGVSFIVALAVSKTRIWLFFGGSIWFFLVVAVICFFVLKGCIHTISGKKKRL